MSNGAKTISGTDFKIDSNVFFKNWLSDASKINTLKDCELKVSDLFCGPGGFSYGFKTALIENGISCSSELAVDYDQAALDTYKANQSPRVVRKLDLFEAFIVDVELARKKLLSGSTVPLKDALLRTCLRNTDVLLCSPPCRGFSNLNNSTRRDDPRNVLLISGVGAAIASGVDTIVVENVVEMRKDKNGVMYEGIEILEKFGYQVEQIILRGEDLGIPQTRRRLILLASKSVNVGAIKKYLQGVKLNQVPVSNVFELSTQNSWDDLENPFMNATPVLSKENVERIEFFHEPENTDLFDLPNHLRPDCHKDGHSYPSVYGRIFPDKPAGTITTGFLSIGRGRFTHPFEKRGLNLREGARIQSFPDHYKFVCDSKTTIASRLIGDAVPPLMSYWIGKAYAHALNQKDIK